ncbi:MAG: hypothetical protein P4L57_12565 [Rhizomicrobium sp.]|nr:hypothetical protein [Rhizomicrobium sp.]
MRNDGKFCQHLPDQAQIGERKVSIRRWFGQLGQFGDNLGMKIEKLVAR